MTASAEQLCSDLLALPEADRAELARLLLESLGEESAHATNDAWDEELARRAEEIRRGHVTGISPEELFARLDARLSAA